MDPEVTEGMMGDREVHKSTETSTEIQHCALPYRICLRTSSCDVRLLTRILNIALSTQELLIWESTKHIAKYSKINPLPIVNPMQKIQMQTLPLPHSTAYFKAASYYGHKNGNDLMDVTKDVTPQQLKPWPYMVCALTCLNRGTASWNTRTRSWGNSDGTLHVAVLHVLAAASESFLSRAHNSRQIHGF